MRKSCWAGMILILLFPFYSCRTSSFTPSTSASRELPLLGDGQYVSLIRGFNAENPVATTDSIEKRWNEAVAAGMKVGRLQIDWPEMEPEAGSYDKNALSEPLAELEQEQLRPFLLISAYDSEGPVLPEDLEGKALNDEEVLDRFKKLMDWVIPMLTESNGWVIAISNEPDVNLPEERGLKEEVLTFLEVMRDYIHQLQPEMAVTVTMNEGSLKSAVNGVQEIAEVSDVICFNYYGGDYRGMAYEDIKSSIRIDIENMLALDEGKQLIIQELGMPSGDQLANSSDEIQQLFYRAFFETMEEYPKLRAAVIFQLVDWSPGVIEWISELLREENSAEEFILQYEEILGTIGLIRYEDGTS